MDVQSLTENCTQLLVALFSGVLQGAGERTADELYGVVARRLGAVQANDALSAFEEHPQGSAERAAFVSTLRRQLARNEQFRMTVAEIVSPTAEMSPGARIGNTSVRAGNGSIAAGGNISQTQNRKNYGGLVVGVVAVAVVFIVVLFAGRAVVNLVVGGSDAHLTGSSTCRDFLASSDTAAKAAIMKQLYLSRNKPELAADPFIIQNAEYFCGNRPDAKLADIVAARG